MANINISIIGGGAAGSAVLIELCHHFIKSKLQNVTIKIFDPNILGEGVAYRTRDPNLLLNTSAQIVTIKSRNPRDFLEWLKEEENIWRRYFPTISKDYTEQSFMPRVLTYFYIKSRIASAIEEAMRYGINIQHVRERIINIEYIENEIQIFSANKKYDRNTACIICIGHVPPHGYSHLEEHPNYIQSIYENESRLQYIPSDKQVLILGSQLSAIDAIMLLKHLTHHITLASRKGELPAVRKSLGKMQGFHLTDDFIEEFFLSKGKLSKEEIEHEINIELSMAYNNKNPSILKDLEKPILNAEENLEKEIKACELGTNYWEESVIAIIKFIKKTWSKLTTEDQIIFHKNHERFINRIISAFPLEVSYKILNMFKQKNLKIKSGVVKVETRKDKFVAHYEKDGIIQTEEFDYVINATSSKLDILHKPSVLLKNMINNHLVKISAHNGLVLNDDLTLQNDLRINLPLYAAGPATAGEKIFTNLLWTCAEHAELISDEIFRNVMKHEDEQ